MMNPNDNEAATVVAATGPQPPVGDAKPDAKAKKPKAPEAVPAWEATKPAEVDANGYVLDGHGLPISGPARIRELEALGIDDPAIANEEQE